MSQLEKPFYKISELAAILSVSDDTIRRRIKYLRIKVSGDTRQLVRLERAEAQRLIDFIAKHRRKK